MGPGSSINIFSDNWIPGTSTLKPLLRPDIVAVERVDELFVPGTRVWNEELIRNSFLFGDAEAILRIRPGVRMLENTLAWNFKKHGLYSVRSAYRHLKDISRQDEANNNETTSGDAGVWNKLWKLKIPPKIRIFWWRAVNNFLPSKKELKRRHVEQDDHCDTCGMEGESLFHVTFECSTTRRFWQAAKELVVIKLSAMHPVTWTRDLLDDSFLPTEKVTFICGVWSLWSGRNARRHGKERWNPGQQ